MFDNSIYITKRILIDEYTCCRVCFEVLSVGDTIYTNEQGEVICKECVKNFLLTKGIKQEED